MRDPIDKIWDLQIQEHLRRYANSKEMEFLYGTPTDAVLRTWLREAEIPRRHPIHRFVKWAARR